MDRMPQSNIGSSSLLLAILLLMHSVLSAQLSDPDVLFEIPGEFESMQIDRLGQTYTIDADGEIRLYTLDGKLRFEFSDPSWGPIGHLDVTNPLRILVYYPDFATIIVLDNTMTRLARYDLREMGFDRVMAVGTAGDGTIWIWDEANAQLVKVDERGQVLRRSDPVNLVLDDVIHPTELVQRNKQVYVKDPAMGLLVFDQFGTYNFTIGDSNMDDFQALTDRVVWRENQDWFVYFFDSYLQERFPFPTENFKEFHFHRDRLYLLTPTGLQVRSYP